MKAKKIYKRLFYDLHIGRTFLTMTYKNTHNKRSKNKTSLKLNYSSKCTIKKSNISDSNKVPIIYMSIKNKFLEHILNFHKPSEGKYQWQF